MQEQLGPFFRQQKWQIFGLMVKTVSGKTFSTFFQLSSCEPFSVF